MIRFENVTKRYKDATKPALDSVSVEITPGEFVFLVGASGSGKSTCLHLILRQQVPTSGNVLVLGSDLRKMSNRRAPYFRRHIGSVFQDFRLLPSKTVAQNVAFALQVTGASRGFIQQAVPNALELVGLTGKGKRMPEELSGGERQRVAIARAIVNNPKILLADEPTGNLDPATSTGIMQLLAQINASGTTVVMATHEAGFVDQMQRRVLELHQGVLIRDERQGGYGDTSAIPKLAPAEERGAASNAALTAVLEIQRAVAAGEQLPGRNIVVPAASAGSASDVVPAVVTPAVVTPAAGAPAAPLLKPPAPPLLPPAAAPVAAVSPADAASEENSQTPPVAEPRTEPRALTRPITLPVVDIAELGVADRLGLSDLDDDKEVGPTS